MPASVSSTVGGRSTSCMVVCSFKGTIKQETRSQKLLFSPAALSEKRDYLVEQRGQVLRKMEADLARMAKRFGRNR